MISAYFQMMQYIKIPITRRLWMKQVMQRYSLSEIPVVCSVNGACVGTGFCLAAVSDAVVASEKGEIRNH